MSGTGDMRIVRTYTHDMTGAHYALIQALDGATVEIKSREPLTDDGWLKLAEEVLERLMSKPEPVMLVECEDGTIV